MLTIKEYATLRGKAVQSVYRQIKAKTNKPLLEGHITTTKIGNKQVQVLDEDAVKILDNASRQDPITVERSSNAEEIARLKSENDSLKIQIMELQKQVIGLQDSLLTAKQDLLEAKESEQPKRRWWKFWEQKSHSNCLFFW